MIDHSTQSRRSRQTRQVKAQGLATLRAGSRKTGQILATILLSACLPTLTPLAMAEGGGNVQPGTAKPHGYSLDQMAGLMALFNSSQNNPTYYPQTPFQILYVPFQNPQNPTSTLITCSQPAGSPGILFSGGNTFVVRPGTPFFVPLQSFDDSPAFLAPFPKDKGQVADYVFGPDNYGAKNFQVKVERCYSCWSTVSIGTGESAPPLLEWRRRASYPTRRLSDADERRHAHGHPQRRDRKPGFPQHLRDRLCYPGYYLQGQSSALTT